jgi:hypothetical protein
LLPTLTLTADLLFLPLSSWLCVQKGAPEHQRITNVDLVFTAVMAGNQPSSMFYPPSDCKC